MYGPSINYGDKVAKDKRKDDPKFDAMVGTQHPTGMDLLGAANLFLLALNFLLLIFLLRKRKSLHKSVCLECNYQAPTAFQGLSFNTLLVAIGDGRQKSCSVILKITI